MKFKEQALKITTILSAFLLLAPITFMLIISAIMLVTRGKILVDILIPLEVFPIVLTGAGILTLIACKINVYKKRICSMSIALVAMLIGGQYLAIVTGLADGSTPASGWPLIIVMSTIIVYDILTIVIGIYGIRIYQHLKIQKAVTESK